MLSGKGLQTPAAMASLREHPLEFDPEIVAALAELTEAPSRLAA